MKSTGKEKKTERNEGRPSLIKRPPRFGWGAETGGVEENKNGEGKLRQGDQKAGGYKGLAGGLRGSDELRSTNRNGSPVLRDLEVRGGKCQETSSERTSCLERCGASLSFTKTRTGAMIE